MNPRDILKSPLVYETFQQIVGGSKMRYECLKVLEPRPGQRVLDIGCGPAYYLSAMPEVEYHGFDTDSGYIAHARKKFGSRGTFYDVPYTREWADRLGRFDRVLLMGLLHHLSDEDSDNLLGLLADVLAPGGRVVALDTVVHDGQNAFEHALAIHDRGEFVRRPEGFVDLAKKRFGRVDGHIARVFRVPRVHWVMTLEEPLSEPG